jgi:V/A-type H+-transporting ATPase subunit A
VSQAHISHIRGPVLQALTQGPFRINEAVRIGESELLGEVLRAEGDHITVQVYEDTTGLRPGDPVTGSGGPLSVRLGPGILGRIFDGLLRPLSGTESDFVHPGIYAAEPLTLPFEAAVAAGDSLAPGQAFGRVTPEGARPQRCLVPPTIGGEVTAIEAAGDYREDATLLRLRDRDGEEHAVAMSHAWPVRRPRPLGRRTALDRPLLTGQRILDGLFPVARGGTAAMPGGFGTGKTVLQQSLAKWCEADVIVYVGCGERGNEMTEVLHEFPQLEDPRSGRPLLERSVIIANTSNMPVAAREASIYTGVTVAEYFRDQGLHVALMADSTSRWAEALREISGRLGELPAEGGYPAYLPSRLAEFYERAAPVETLGGDSASVTLIGAVSPPGGDFSEPVTVQTKRFTRCFWPLDRERARSRFFPAVNPLQAYSEDVADLAPWWRQQEHPEWDRQRRRFLALLEEEQRLQRMARIVGKESLPARQQLTLLCADLVNEGFLRQSSFDAVDRYTSPARQGAMMRTLNRFLDAAERAVDAGVPVDRIAALPLLRELRRMGEEIGEERLEGFDELDRRIDEALDRLTREEGANAG